MITPDQSIDYISTSAIIESPFNPRKRFDEAGLAELAADIKTQGILQPLVIRPLGNGNGELIFGHRRLRAARLAGLETVPCIVRNEMTDEQVRRAQIGENLQREDVHPIEEAEGYQALMDEHGVTAEQLVADTGKSRSYIYGRLKLLQAIPAVRERCLKGEIGSEVALLIARLRVPKLQEQALAATAKEWRAKLDDGGKASFRTIRDMLAEKFTLDLDNAIFPINDVSLIPTGFPDALPCEICPKRSGNAPEYQDLASGEATPEVIYAHGKTTWKPKPAENLCTDPECFDAKKKMHLAIVASTLYGEGKTVVTGNKARAALDAHGDLKSDYIPLAEAKKALKTAGIKQAPQTLTIINQRTGKHVFAVKREDLKEAGVKITEPKKSGNSYDHGKWERERKEREAKQAHEQQIRTAVWSAIHEANKTAARNTIELQIAAAEMLTTCNWYFSGELIRPTWGVTTKDELAKRIGSMTADECVRLMVDLVGAQAIKGGSDDELKRIAKHYGVDAEGIRASMTVQTPAPSKPEAKKKPAKKAAKAPKAKPAVATEDNDEDDEPRPERDPNVSDMFEAA